MSENIFDRMPNFAAAVITDGQHHILVQGAYAALERQLVIRNPRAISAAKKVFLVGDRVPVLAGGQVSYITDMRLRYEEHGKFSTARAALYAYSLALENRG